MPNLTHNLVGYHGTNADNVNSIKNTNFEPSEGKSHEAWLGDGAYFFTNGISVNPQENAAKWAIVSAWDNKEKDYSYNSYSVLICNIEVDDLNFLDLTTPDGVEILEYLRDKYIDKFKERNKRILGNNLKDGHIINDAINNGDLSIEVVKANFYIKFTSDTRKLGAQFKIPNCTILSVRKPSLNIDTSSIVEITSRQNITHHEIKRC